MLPCKIYIMLYLLEYLINERYCARFYYLLQINFQLDICIVAIFFSAISEIDENFKGVLVKIREVLHDQLFVISDNASCIIIIL